MSARQILDRIADAHAPSWSDISRLLNVPVSSVYRWQRGHATPSAEDFAMLERVAETLDRLAEFGVADPGSYLFRPLLDDYTMTPALLTEHGIDVLKLAAASDTEAFLDERRPGWRTEYWSDWLVTVMSDGHKSIVYRGHDGRELT